MTSNNRMDGLIRGGTMFDTMFERHEAKRQMPGEEIRKCLRARNQVNHPEGGGRRVPPAVTQV
jgi:hypothetical protein